MVGVCNGVKGNNMSVRSGKFETRWEKKWYPRYSHDLSHYCLYASKFRPHHGMQPCMWQSRSHEHVTASSQWRLSHLSATLTIRPHLPHQPVAICRALLGRNGRWPLLSAERTRESTGSVWLDTQGTTESPPLVWWFLTTVPPEPPDEIFLNMHMSWPYLKRSWVIGPEYCLSILKAPWLLLEIIPVENHCTRVTLCKSLSCPHILLMRPGKVKQVLFLSLFLLLRSSTCPSSWGWLFTEHFVIHFSHLLWRAPHPAQRTPHWNTVRLRGNGHLLLQFWLHAGWL